MSLSDALGTVDVLEEVVEWYVFTEISKNFSDSEIPLSVDLVGELEELRGELEALGEASERRRERRGEEGEEEVMIGATKFHERVGKLMTSVNDAHLAYLKPLPYYGSYFLLPLSFSSYVPETEEKSVPTIEREEPLLSSSSSSSSSSFSPRLSKRHSSSTFSSSSSSPSFLNINVKNTLFGYSPQLTGADIGAILAPSPSSPSVTESRHPMDVISEFSESVGISRDKGTRFNLAVDSKFSQRSLYTFSRPDSLESVKMTFFNRASKEYLGYEDPKTHQVDCFILLLLLLLIHYLFIIYFYISI